MPEASNGYVVSTWPSMSRQMWAGNVCISNEVHVPRSATLEPCIIGPFHQVCQAVLRVQFLNPGRHFAPHQSRYRAFIRQRLRLVHVRYPKDASIGPSVAWMISARVMSQASRCKKYPPFRPRLPSTRARPLRSGKSCSRKRAGKPWRSAICRTCVCFPSL